MSPKVSVIIPVYNGENSIEISLKSLSQQENSNFEVIIIDDGSKDSTKDIVSKYIKSDNRFKYFFQENSGVSVARNKGIDIAQGKYISFLDSDDFYENTFIEKMLKKIESESADVCYCGYNIVSPNETKVKKTKFTSKNLLNNYILGKVSIHTTGWLISKKLIDESNIRFLEGVSWGEDFEFFCEILARSKKSTFVSEYLTNYRVEFEENRLSSFSLNKMDKDYESIERIKANKGVNKNNAIENALIDYRLSALLTYRLLEAIRLGEDKDTIISYLNKYKKYMIRFGWNNGIRSLKLNLSKVRLKKKVKDIIRG